MHLTDQSMEYRHIVVQFGRVLSKRRFVPEAIFTWLTKRMVHQNYRVSNPAEISVSQLARSMPLRLLKIDGIAKSPINHLSL
jgi:hypothetical protein